jgi:hypothetical protein
MQLARIERELMAAHAPLSPRSEPLTLLDLVSAVAEFASSEAEVVAVVEHLVQTGQVVLVGQFRGSHLLAN